MVINFERRIRLKRKEFTSFDVAAVVRELREKILDSRVSKIYQLDGKTLLFKLHKPDNPAFRLVLEAGRRLHLTSYVMEKPLVPPAFCMALRKHLRSAWLTNAKQYEFERVVVLSFKTKTSELQLALELFGDGNIILVDGKGKILQALTYKRMRDRNILRNETFAFAPSSGQNPFNVNREESIEELRSFGDVEIVRAITRLLSIGGIHAEETLLRAEIDKTKACAALGKKELNTIFDGLQNLLLPIVSGKLEPCAVLGKDGEFIDVVPFKLKRYESFKCQPYESFNAALDEFYVRVIAVEKAKAGVEVDALKREAERLRRVIESQEKTLTEAKAKAERSREIGDAIYANVGELQVLLDRFLVAKESGKEWSEIVSEILADKRRGVKPWVFFDSFDSRNLVVNVCLDDSRFGLNLRGKLFENAGQFYEQSKRAMQRLNGAKAALEDTSRKLMETEAKIRETEALERVKPTEAVEELARRKVKRKEWFEKFRWFVSSDGFLVVAGKDAVSNEVLVKKYTEPHDVVFHADVVGAPFVVVKTGDKKPSEQCLREAGEFAAAFSRGWREGFGSVDVYWVKPNQLSKGGPSGESVPHGAFVVSGQRNWLRGAPLKLAVGVVVGNENEIEFVGGPVDAVKAKANAYMVVVPGDLTGKELFRLVLKGLAGRMSKEQREKVLKASVEEIREFIPYNKGRILET